MGSLNSHHPYYIPPIDTLKIPPQALVGTELGRAVMQLDDITPEQVGTPTHYQKVRQVINDARDSGFDILSAQ